MTETESVHQFDVSRAKKYDEKIRRLTPGYEALHQMANHLLRLHLPSHAHLLVVGAGTGMDIITCGIANPQWEFTAVEPSEKMLALCRKNVKAADLQNRVHFHSGYVETLPVANFDAATSIFVSHFITDQSDKLKFFTAIAQRLSKGAPFLLADLYGAKKSADFPLLFRAWQEFYTASGAEKSEVEKSFAYIEQEISFVAESQLQLLLHQSGFSGAHKFFQSFLFGGWLCQRNS